MLDDKDVQKLKEELTTKEDLEKFSIRAFETFATKEDIKDLKQDIGGLREQIQTLTISIDRLVKAIENLGQEYFAMKSQIDRHEKWIQKLAEKLGVKLEY